MPEAVRVLIALLAAIAIYLVGVRIVRVMMAPPPPDEPDLSLLKPVDYRYRCMVCGTEVTMTATPEVEVEGDEDGVPAAPDAPRHCREDMHLLGIHTAR
jgi:hypothetical protein